MKTILTSFDFMQNFGFILPSKKIIIIFIIKIIIIFTIIVKYIQGQIQKFF